MGRRKREVGHSVAEFVAALSMGPFYKNIARVDALAKIYDALPASVKNRHSGGGADVLRAGVVLLHASLEDLLRRIAAYRIPDGEEEALKSIPLVGSKPREKFTLDQLAQFRGKSVDEVLSASVRYFYDSHVTFNSVADVVAVLKSSDIKQDRVKHFYPALGVMISRRHDIVHRADLLGRRPLKDDVVDIAHRMQPLSVSKIRRWTSVTRRFGQAILVEMAQVRLADLSVHVKHFFGEGPLPRTLR